MFFFFPSSSSDGGEIEQSEEDSGKHRKRRRRRPASSSAAPEIRSGGEGIDVGAPFLINLTEEGRKKEGGQKGRSTTEGYHLQTCR